MKFMLGGVSLQHKKNEKKHYNEGNMALRIISILLINATSQCEK